MIKIEIDDKQILNFIKKSPARARWASIESLKMCGGHYRKEMRSHIEKGDPSWAPLSELGKRIRRDSGKRVTTPLHGLSQFVRFVYGKRKGVPTVSVGFIGKIAKIAKSAQFGGRKRVSDSRRKFFHSKGIHLKDTTKFIKIPARPIIVPFWKKHEKSIKQYVEKKFFEKFFSKSKPGLKL